MKNKKPIESMTVAEANELRSQLLALEDKFGADHRRTEKIKELNARIRRLKPKPKPS